MSIWVLTEEYNAYDQYGEYFVWAWTHKPTSEELKKYVKDTSRIGQEDYIGYVLNGGGQIDLGKYYDTQWYLLKELK